MGDIIAKLEKLVWRDDLIQGWYVKTNRVDRERHQGGRNIPLTPPPQLYSNVGRKLFFTRILCYLLYTVGFHIMMLPVVSRSGRPQVKMEANYWIKQGVYCKYVMFDKSRTWFFSVRDCWHDCQPQYQSYTFTLLAVKDHVQDYSVMSNVTYVFDLPGHSLS